MYFLAAVFNHYRVRDTGYHTISHESIVFSRFKQLNGGILCLAFVADITRALFG